MRRYILIAIIVAALVFIKIFFLAKPAEQQMKPGSGAPPPSPATGFVVRPSKIENKISVTGTLRANEEVMLVPEASGKISAIYFTEGSVVKKGDLLVKINDADVQAQLNKLEVQSRQAAENEARQQKLFDVHGVSREEFEMSQTAAKAAKADVDLLRAQIAKTEVHAPFSGTVGIRNVSEGSFVNPSTVIASIQQTNPVKIDFSVPEKYAAFVKKGQEIDFTCSGLSNVLKGKISAIEPKVDPVSRTIALRAIAANESGALFPGAFAHIDLRMGERNDALLIPTEAIIPILKGQKVFLYKGGLAVESRIETGVRTDTKAEVISGIQAGDTVLTSGIMQLKSGSPVKLKSIK